MATCVALLRAVNVGGTGKLPMTELRAMAEALGFSAVRTYIASGNLVFGTRLAASTAKARLEAALHERFGKPCRVLIRSADELAAAIAANPFPEAAPNRLLVLFLDAPPDGRVLATWPVPGRERLALHGRELFVHFPDGMGPSKLRIPFADIGTGRNLNTVRTLLAMARGDG